MLWLGASIAASSAPTDRVSGSINAGGTGGGRFDLTFSCVGTPTCVGTFTGTAFDSGCSNGLTFSNESFQLAGLDLSHAGAISGTVTFQHDWSSTLPGASGTCGYTVKSNSFVLNYAATWDGSIGVLSYTSPDPADPYHVNGSFTASLAAAPSPVFPMAVSGSVTTTTANASAQIQPRAQDVGTTQSVFVFAHAPASVVKDLVKRAPSGGSLPFKPEENAIICVLAQVGSDGQLHAVSSSTMQAYLTGVLSSQSQAVNVLNNVATPNVAGATMFVGYGANAQSMLANGIYQNALSVPGPVQCTASLASAPAPNSPGPLSGLWYNAAESGWGISFTQRRNILFAAWYTYDASGAPKWYVASNCTMPSGSTGASGTCTGDLYAVDGPAFFGVPFNPSAVHVTTAGNLQATFTDANSATMTYTVAGQTRTVAITRQVFRNGTAPAVDYTDLWYNAAESGWGMSITHQSDTMFLAWYVYDGNGKAFWYVAPACSVSGSSCSGSLYRTTGPAFGPSFNSSQVQAFQVGSAIVSFIDANHAVLSYTVDGVTATKTITRQAF